MELTQDDPIFDVTKSCKDANFFTNWKEGSTCLKSNSVGLYILIHVY